MLCILFRSAHSSQHRQECGPRRWEFWSFCVAWNKHVFSWASVSSTVTKGKMTPGWVRQEHVRGGMHRRGKGRRSPPWPPTEQKENGMELTTKKPASGPSSAFTSLCDLSLSGPQFPLSTSKGLNTLTSEVPLGSRIPRLCSCPLSPPPLPPLGLSMCVRACARMCARVCARVYACKHACVYACVCSGGSEKESPAEDEGGR